MARANAEPKADTTLTAYVVLELTSVDGKLAWCPVQDAATNEPKVFVVKGGKPGAIRAHTGEGPDALAGSWKAISLSAWKGGETTGQETVTVRKPLDEAL